MIDSDYALALQLQEEFNLENAENTHFAVRPKPGNSTFAIDDQRSERTAASLIDPSWELIDPNPDARALFIEFNDKYFWGALSAVEVRWSPRMTLCAGVCVYEGRGGMCSIRLSEPLLKLRPRKDLVETLLHEMIHAYLFVTRNDRDRDGHGPEFQKHMHRLNSATGAHITIYHSFHDEVDNYRTHWWRCDGPCKNRKPYFGYVKRATNRAPSDRDFWWAEHQHNCGGTYVKVKEPDDYAAKKSKKVKENDEKKTTTTGLSNWLLPSDDFASIGTIKSTAKDLECGSGEKYSTARRIVDDTEFEETDYVLDDDLLAMVDTIEGNSEEIKQPEIHKKVSDFQMGSAADHKSRISQISNTEEKPLLNLGSFEEPKFPGKGFTLGHTSSETQSSANQVIRRIPGIGSIEVRGSNSRGGSADLNSARELAGKSFSGNADPKKNPKQEPKNLGIVKSTDVFSKSHEKRNVLDTTPILPADFKTRKKNVATKEQATSAKRLRQDDTEGQDIRSFLTNRRLPAGTVVKVPNFVSVSNPNYHKRKENLENAAPGLLSQRKAENNQTRPTKKARLDNDDNFVCIELGTMSGDSLTGTVSKHINPNNTRNFLNEASCDKSSEASTSEQNAAESRTSNSTDDRMAKVDVDSDRDECRTIASIVGRIRNSMSATSDQDEVSEADDASAIEIESTVSEDLPELVDPVPQSRAQCPACGVFVDIAVINEHLDECLS